ncbi:hypothetical protein J1N35_025864, partial [Gossypium stocksii]
TRATRENKVFRKHPHINTKEQEEQPLTVEARLSRIEARLDTMETQVATILNILQSFIYFPPNVAGTTTAQTKFWSRDK